MFEWIKDVESLQVNYDEVSGAGLLLSNDYGVSWTNSGAGSLNYVVFGTYTTIGPIVDTYTLLSVDVRLDATDSGNAVLYASTPTFNTPEALAP